MKYSRISFAESMPTSASNNFHCLIASNGTSVMGNNNCLPSRFLPLARIGNFGFDPVTAHAVLGEDQQQLVMQADGLVDLLVQLAAALHFLRRKPAAHTLGLQVSMEPLGKLLVFGRIADEAGVELNGPSHHRADVGDELVGNAAATQKRLGNLAARLVDGVNANGRRSEVVNSLETLS